MFEVGYKIIRELDGQYVSMMEDGASCVVYPIGESPSVERFGPMCLWVESAKDFAAGYMRKWAAKFPQHRFLLFRCLYERSKEETVWNGRRTTLLSALPSGAVLGDTLILLEEVDRVEATV